MSMVAAALTPVARGDLRGARLAIAWLTYVGLAVFLLAVYVPALPVAIASLRANPVSRVALRDGLPWDAMWIWLVSFALLDTAVHVAVAALILWRTPRDGFALVTSFALLGAGLVHSSGQFAAPADPDKVLYVAFANGAILLLGFVFPDGRFVPRWGLWLWLLVMLGTHIIPFVVAPAPLAVAIRSYGGIPLLVGIVIAQIERSRHHSSALQRAQAKWFLFGYLTFTAVFQLRLALPNLFPDVFAPTAEANLALVFIGRTAQAGAAIIVPVAVLIAILRWRLFSIDLIINRTLVYGGLTAILIAFFALASATLQRLLIGAGIGNSDVASVTTAAIVVGAFLPLRRALQSLADRYVPERVLLALLFTDLVTSTEVVLALGDARWRELRSRYASIIRHELTRFEGREVDDAGDGFFATFRTPGQALRCASAMRAAGRGLGLKTRSGIHVGECEVHGSKVSGINVHTAARVMSAAAPDEILVSSTTRELVAGSQVRFTDRGSHQLKGLPDQWRLYAVLDE